MNATRRLRRSKADRARTLWRNAGKRARTVVSLLIVWGSFVSFAAEETHFRAARSVHLSYSASKATAFYNEIVVEQSVNGSYFMACGWNTGYFGIQQLDAPKDKVVLVSVWDPTHGDDPASVNPEDRVEVLFQGEGVRIKRFGGEGTGGQCMWRCDWQLNKTNRFVVLARSEAQKCAYTAWVSTDGTWKKLATFRTRTPGALSGCYSFIEDFRRDGKSAGETRLARFGNGWIRTTKGDWQPVTQARFTASGAEWESKDNIDAGTARGMFFLATGGNIKMSTDLKSLLLLPRPDGTTPPKLPVNILEP